MQGEVTYDDLARTARKSVVAGLHFAVMHWDTVKPSYHEFVDKVHAAIAVVYGFLERNPQALYQREEDHITLQVVNELLALGFDASMEALVGGHCDLSVRLGTEFLWLAEAKIARDAGWLWQGYGQLSTRYAVGGIGSDKGGMLIYCRQPRIDKVMENWQKRLKSEGVLHDYQDRGNLCLGAFSTTVPAERTGRPFETVHFPLSVYYAPVV